MIPAAATGLRMAGSAGAIGRIGSFISRNFIPKTVGEAAVRFGPDAGFSVLSAAMAPGDFLQSPAERVGYGLESFANQALPGVLLGGLAGAGARRMGMNANRASQLAGYTDLGGSVAVPMLTYGTPLTPVANYATRRSTELMQQEQGKMTESAYEQGYQEAMAQLMGGGFGATPAGFSGSQVLNSMGML